jgi:hypothetical protein
VCWFGAKGHSTHEAEAHDHCKPSTLIGAKGGAGPSSLHTMLEGCKAYINSCVASNEACFRGQLDYVQSSPLGGRPNTKPGDQGN